MAFDLSSLLQFGANGVVLGALLALSAIGLTLVYGILNLSNFAHGDLITLGAYVAFFYNVLVAPDEVLVVAALLAAGLVALPVVDRLTTRRLSRGEGVVLAGAGSALFFVAAAQHVFAGTAASNPVAGFFLDELTLVALLGIIVVPLASVGLDFAVWRPLRRRRATTLTLLIVSIGVALIVRHAIVMVPDFGAGIHLFDRPVEGPLCFSGLAAPTGDPVCAGGLVITRDKLLAIAVASVLILGVHLLLAYTRVGKALRAMSDNLDLARVSGIDVDRMVLYVWILAGALGAVAGLLLALISNVNPHLGWYLLLPTFAAVILGGVGSPYGAMAGAMIIGISMEMTSLFEIPEYRLAVAFGVLLVMLLVRPQGLFGGKVA